MKEYRSIYKHPVIIGPNRVVVEFVNYRYRTRSEQEQKVIEGSDGYGRYIFPAEPVKKEVKPQPVGPKEPEAPVTEVIQPGGTEVFVCEVCGKIFASAAALRGHMGGAHGEKKKKK